MSSDRRKPCRTRSRRTAVMDWSPSSLSTSEQDDDGKDLQLSSASFHTTETEDESEQEESKLGKAVQWADCAGKELAVTYAIDFLPYISTRIVVLLLDVHERLFEFVQCEYDTDARLTATDLLSQLPKFASFDFLARQDYHCLCRRDQEIITMLPIQNYPIREGEILIAASAKSNAKPQLVMDAARSLLSQKKLLRSVQKAKLSGRALQRLLSSAELAGAPPRPPHALDDDDESSMEGGNGEDHTALIVKVLSRELGDEDFADFSFPVFDAVDDFDTHAESSGPDAGWLRQLISADSWFTGNDDGPGFCSSPVAMFTEQDDEDDLASFCHMTTEETSAVEAFSSSQHEWKEEDNVIPDFFLEARGEPFPGREDDYEGARLAAVTDVPDRA